MLKTKGLYMSIPNPMTMSNLNNNEANKMETEQMENVEKMLGGITPADHGNRPIAIRNGYGKIIKLIRW